MAYNRISVILQEEEMRRLSNTMSITVGGQSSVVDQQKLVKSVRRYNHAKTAEASYKSQSHKRHHKFNSGGASFWMLHTSDTQRRLSNGYYKVYHWNGMCPIRSGVQSVSGDVWPSEDLCIIDVHKDAPREYKPLLIANPWDGTLLHRHERHSLHWEEAHVFCHCSRQVPSCSPARHKVSREREGSDWRRSAWRAWLTTSVRRMHQANYTFLGSLMIADNRKVANMVRGFDVAVTIKQEIKVAIAQLQLTIPWNAFLNDDYMDFKSIDSSKYWKGRTW